MSIKFEGLAVFVRDIGVSRRFYEQTLGQEVEMDNGPHVVFKGFSIWEVDSAQEIIFDGTPTSLLTGTPKSFELYFETHQLNEVWEQVKSAGVEQIHPIREHPWGQRGFRIYDPDKHIIEVAEPLTLVVKRFVEMGLSIEEISQRTTIPETIVREMISGNGPSK